MERSFPVSLTTRPVTQTAEVEVKRASTNLRGSLAAEKGNQRRIPPVTMTAAKLSTKILVGERCLENKLLIRIRIFIGMKRSIPPMRVRLDFTQRSLLCQYNDGKIRQTKRLHSAGCLMVEADQEGWHSFN
jgi:hypothetical protein